jgi:copper(I)-binding protein
MTVVIRASMSDPALLRVFYNHIDNLLELCVLRWIAAWALGALMVVMMHPALADEPIDLGDITIEAATATPGAKGGRSKVRFQIINNSRTDLHLLGISTPLAEKAELVARIGAKRTSVLQSIGIPSEETLDLTTSHLYYEIYPLQEVLQSGDEFPITLHFTGWSKSTLIHIH